MLHVKFVILRMIAGQRSAILTDLPQARASLRDTHAELGVLQTDGLVSIRHLRPRTDKTHSPKRHEKELGKFVEVHSPDSSSHAPEESGVCARLESVRVSGSR